jgi:hypothetical protein
MPCRSDDDDYNGRAVKLKLEEERQKQRQEAAQQEKKADLLTRLLCEACNALDSENMLSEKSHPELFKWWVQHTEKDRARIAREHDKALEEYNKLNNKLKAAQAQLDAVTREKQKIESRKR